MFDPKASPKDINDAIAQIKDKMGIGEDKVCAAIGQFDTPEELVEAVIDRLHPRHGVEVVSITDEDEYFPPPRELRELVGAERLADDRRVAASDVLAELARE